MITNQPASDFVDFKRDHPLLLGFKPYFYHRHKFVLEVNTYLIDQIVNLEYNSFEIRLGVIFLDKSIGKVVHYYDKLGVAIIDLESGGLKVGDEVKFKSGEEEFTQKVASLQVDHKAVESVKKGDSFGVKVDTPTKVGTTVYLA